MTLRDFVDDSSLSLEVVVGGDLRRTVRWVHVTELIDPAPYLEGGEFILSAGVWRERGGEVERFVGALRHSGVAALGWGLLAEDERVPEEVVAACRRVDLPLISVPTNTPFIAIERRFFEYLQRRREEELRRSLAYNERLIRSISSLPGGVRGVLKTLGEELGVWVRLERRGEKTGNGMPEDGTRFPVVHGEHLVARLLVGIPPRELGPRQRAAIDQAIPLLEFVLAHEQELRQAERRLAAELVEGVLTGRTRFAAGRLRAYGLDPEGTLVGLVVRSGTPEDDAGRVQRVLTALGGEAVVAVWQGDVTAIFQPAGGRPDLERLGDAAVQALGSGRAVGVGSPAGGVDELRRSLIQARQAAELARREPGKGYVVHDRVESQALLLALQDQDVLAAFRNALLGPIVEYDARRNTRLLETLEAFILSGGRWEETARNLHIHVNTLRHRLSRCEELTGRDLSTMESRVDFYLALRSRPQRSTSSGGV
ncbi:PucR family transcriptional regulator [Rubrobacter calidifluminis]|uniref:PucR family transcriptional regulator n=1 Tax=Rubrobacter calidifluminis TaxID=1392640 RepID=UPI00236311B9|nr:PucR family transcriptional regulator [Rubrobacter calidifluminis]